MLPRLQSRHQRVAVCRRYDRARARPMRPCLVPWSVVAQAVCAHVLFVGLSRGLVRIQCGPIVQAPHAFSRRGAEASCVCRRSSFERDSSRYAELITHQIEWRGKVHSSYVASPGFRLPARQSYRQDPSALFSSSLPAATCEHDRVIIPRPTNGQSSRQPTKA